MKSRKQTIQQYFVLSLLVVYQLISLVHLAQMQRFRADVGSPHHFSLMDLIHKNHTTDNTKGLYQRGTTFTAGPDRKVLIQAKALVPVFLFVLAGFYLLPVAKRVSAYLVLFKIPATHTYLSFRTLRI